LFWPQDWNALYAIGDPMPDYEQPAVQYFDPNQASQFCWCCRPEQCKRISGDLVVDLDCPSLSKVFTPYERR
jgi:hypothetical protein